MRGKKGGEIGPMNDRDDNEQRCSRSPARKPFNPSIVLTRAGDSVLQDVTKSRERPVYNEAELVDERHNGLYVSGVIYLSDYRWEIASQLPHCQPGWRGGETTFYRGKSVIIEPIVSLPLFSFSLFRGMVARRSLDRIGNYNGIDWNGNFSTKIKCFRGRFMFTKMLEMLRNIVSTIYIYIYTKYSGNYFNPLHSYLKKLPIE